jgi:hypothetical protein
MIILAAIAVPLAVLACLLIGCLPCFQFFGMGAVGSSIEGDDMSYDSEDEGTFDATTTGGIGNEGVFATGPSRFSGALVENIIYGRSGGPRFGPPIVVDSGDIVTNTIYGRAPSYHWGSQSSSNQNRGYGPPSNFQRPASYVSAVVPSERWGSQMERAYETIPGDELRRVPMQESIYPVTPGFEPPSRA